MGIHLRGRHSSVEKMSANTDKADNVKNKHKNHFSEKLNSVKMSTRELFHLAPKISKPLVTIPEKSYVRSMSSYLEKYEPDSDAVAELKIKRTVTDAVNINQIDRLFKSTVAAYNQGRSPMRESTAESTDEICRNALLNMESGTIPTSDLSANIILKTLRSERMPHITECIKTLSMDQPSFNKYMDDKIGRLSPENQALTNAIFGKIGSEMVIKNEIGQPNSNVSLQTSDFITTVCMQAIIDVSQLNEDCRSIKLAKTKLDNENISSSDLDKTKLDKTEASIKEELHDEKDLPTRPYNKEWLDEAVESIKKELHDEENFVGSANQWIGKSVANKLANYMLTKAPENLWQTED